MRVNKELLKGSVATLALTVLDRKSAYGYELIKEIERTSDGVLCLKEGTLYPILHSLEKEGAIESFWVEKADTRKRKYYRLTKAGRGLLKERTKEWKTFRSVMDQILSHARLLWSAQ